jgi:hypothetical protein
MIKLLDKNSFIKRLIIFELRFMLVAFLLSLIYELAHSPLYLFVDATTVWIKLYYIIHCSFRDLAPFLLGYHIVAIIVKKWLWLYEDYSFRNVALYTFFAFCYTIFSELYHVHILKSWAFKASMPLVPILKIGITPFLQNLILPPIVVKIAKSTYLLNKKGKS